MADGSQGQFITVDRQVSAPYRREPAPSKVSPQQLAAYDVNIPGGLVAHLEDIHFSMDQVSAMMLKFMKFAQNDGLNAGKAMRIVLDRAIETQKLPTRSERREAFLNLMIELRTSVHAREAMAPTAANSVSAPAPDRVEIVGEPVVLPQVQLTSRSSAAVRHEASLWQPPASHLNL
ncbi:MAG TPA: hypothetical protein VFR09_05170 [Alphaproteobacteria bacterium]|nr:hypothetical protein [Alphaproteobacteria bacterium]